MARWSIYWEDAACRLVIPERQVALAHLYKYRNQSDKSTSGKLVWRQHNKESSCRSVDDKHCSNHYNVCSKYHSLFVSLSFSPLRTPSILGLLEIVHPCHQLVTTLLTNFSYVNVKIKTNNHLNKWSEQKRLKFPGILFANFNCNKFMTYKRIASRQVILSRFWLMSMGLVRTDCIESCRVYI